MIGIGILVCPKITFRGFYSAVQGSNVEDDLLSYEEAEHHRVSRDGSDGKFVPTRDTKFLEHLESQAADDDEKGVYQGYDHLERYVSRNVMTRVAWQSLYPHHKQQCMHTVGSPKHPV